MTSRSLLQCVLAAGLLVSVASSTQAAFSTFAEVFTVEGGPAVGFSRFDESSTTGGPVSLNEDIVYDLSEAGGDGEMTFSAQGFASAAFKTVRASTSATLTNSFFDENYVFDNGDPEEGVPTHYTVQSRGGFTETLSYGGTATNYTSRYILRLTGNVQSNDGYGIVRINHAGEEQLITFFSPGNHDQILVSNAFIHGLSPQEFSITLTSGVSFTMEGVSEGNTLSGSANFGSTLELVGIDLRDENGNLVSNDVITSASGTTYDVVAVPEPGTMALLSVLGVGVALRRRQRRAMSV
ncbi:MAG: PEP-CTERM sorting domain-containing protein [Phycisphaeraceae bacterium]